MKKISISIFTLLIFFLSCASENRTSDKAMESFTESSPPDEKRFNQDDVPEPTEQIRKVIQTADYRFQVEGVEKTTDSIRAAVQNFGGYLVSMNQSTTNQQINNNMSIKVPYDQFDNLLTVIDSYAVFVNYRKINAQDVTEEFVDLEARLQTKRDVLTKYENILKNRAKTIEEVLRTEEQIRVLREEIESKEGRLRFLTSQVSLSTINLNFYQKVEYAKAPLAYSITFFDKFKTGFQNGWSWITGLIIIMINIWPFLILFGVLYWKRGSILGRFRRKA